MSLLSVTVKRACIVGVDGNQLDSYVTLKLQNVKSTTVTVKGPNPAWEQDFLFETNDVNSGLLIEVWSRGMIWDRALGYHYLPLHIVPYSNEETPGRWVSLDGELVMRDGVVVGTKNPTGNSLLIDCRFELPFGPYDPPTGWKSLLDCSSIKTQSPPEEEEPPDPENTEAADLQRKLELLGDIMEHQVYPEQNRKQAQYFGHSGYSEDSDYTSDFNYPVGQHANSSASQFRTAAGQLATPQRSLETSRENSYETDEQAPPYQQPSYEQHGHHLSPPGHREGGRRHKKRQEDYYNSKNNSQYEEEAETDPLYYNSRPRGGYKEHRQSSYYEDEYTDSAYGKERYSKTSYKDGSYKRSRHKDANYGDNRYCSYKDKRYKDKHYKGSSGQYKDNGYEYSPDQQQQQQQPPQQQPTQPPTQQQQPPYDEYDYSGSGADCVDCYNQSQSIESEYYDTTTYDQEFYGDNYNESKYSQGYDEEYDASYPRKQHYSKESSSRGDETQSKYLKSYQDNTFYSKPERHKSIESETTEVRRPSLERQTTLYDDQFYYYDSAGQPYTESSYDQSGYNDDYYNKPTDYSQQDGRYVAEDEDRPWDSGGGRDSESQPYYYPRTEGDQYLNEVNLHQNAGGYQSTSRDTQEDEEEIYYSPRQSYEDENYQPKSDYPSTATSDKRKQFSKQGSGSSREGYDYDSYYGDFPPPPKSSGTKKLPQIPLIKQRSKGSSSLPPTPAIPPTMPVEIRSVSQDDYEEPERELDEDEYDRYYTQQPPVSTAQGQRTNGSGGGGYNENYNYAYDSSENLAEEPVNGMMATTVPPPTSSYQDSFSYYYDQQRPDEAVASVSVVPSPKGALPMTSVDSELSRRDTLKKQFQRHGGRKLDSPGRMLLQQNTDSLESRDDELRDSFETAVSSISSSFHRQHSLMSAEPSVDLVSTTSPVITPVSTLTKSGAEAPMLPPPRDQGLGTVAPPPPVPSTVTTTMSYANSVPSTTFQTPPGPRAQLRSQETIESYGEEELLDIDYSRDSPVSVVDKYEPDLPRPDVNSLIEPYLPSTPPKVSSLSRLPSPSTNGGYPVPTLKDDDAISQVQLSHESSLEKPPSDKAKSISFEEPYDEPKIALDVLDVITAVEVPERRRMTAKERWLWAYSKILHQLNVSIQYSPNIIY